jgi:hypothetical protein
MLTNTQRVSEEFQRRIDEALSFVLEAGINMKPLFDFATNRIEIERAKLAELSRLKKLDGAGNPSDQTSR